MAIELAVILALVLINGVLSGAEIAVVAVRRTRIRELIDAGNRAAGALEWLRRNPEAFFATVQIGITVVGATAAAFGGSQVASRLEPGLRRVPGMGEWAQPAAFAMVVAGVSCLSLVVGELVPKSLALRAAERYALLIGRPLLGLSRLAHPLVRLLTASSNVFLRAFGDRTSFAESRLSGEELRQMLDEAATVGAVNPHAGEMAARALDLGELRAGDVMIPARSVVALPRSASREEALRVFVESGHARIPVYDGSIDNMLGYVRAREALAHAARDGSLPLEELLVPGHFVPVSSPAIDLLRALLERRHHLAFVVDEYGGLAGVVTLEDLLEEIVGDILSERDPHLPPPIQRQPDGSVLVQGTTPVREVNRELGLELPEREGSTTVAGLCLALAGGFPRAGDRLGAPDGTVLEVREASPRRVRSVRLVPPPPRAQEPEEEASR